MGDVESCLTRIGSPPSTGPRTGHCCWLQEMTGPKRAVHGRKATAFIPKKAAAPNARKPSSRAAASHIFPSAFSSFFQLFHAFPSPRWNSKLTHRMLKRLKWTTHLSERLKDDRPPRSCPRHRVMVRPLGIPKPVTESDRFDPLPMKHDET